MKKQNSPIICFQVNHGKGKCCTRTGHVHIDSVTLLIKIVTFNLFWALLDKTVQE